MREIKFRVWVKETKDMCYADRLVNIPPAFETEDSQHIMMQYTGLRDRRGVEIYEGDVLKNSHMDDYPHQHGIVEWDTPCPTIRPINSTARRPMSNYGWIDIFAEHYGGVIVIGNIHENPELLGE